MITTEADAKTKWCPFSRVIPGNLVDGVMRHLVGAPAHNRVQEGGQREATTHGAMCCLASGCMAWRWRSLGQVPMLISKMEPGDKAMWRAQGWTEQGEFMVPPPPTKGYCGLAHHP